MTQEEALVECPICHIQRQNLGWHVRRVHNLSKSEFRKLYPDAPLLSKRITDKITIAVTKQWQDNYVAMKEAITSTLPNRKGKGKYRKGVTTMEERFQKGRVLY